MKDLIESLDLLGVGRGVTMGTVIQGGTTKVVTEPGGGGGGGTPISKCPDLLVRDLKMNPF